MRPTILTRTCLAVLFAWCMIATRAGAVEVEVLHWWTAGGEAAALGILKDRLKESGIDWKDMPVAGGGGTQAMTVLRARVTSGNPPVAVQMLGFDIVDWAELGVLADLNETAAAEHWDRVIPAAIQRFSKADGRWIAVPVNVHSVNWVWANQALLDELKIAQPRTWKDFIAALKKVKDSGRIALAHGGQPWQDATLFDSVVMLTGGPDFYRQALIDLDSEALDSDTMREVFDRMLVLRGFVDDNFSGRDWNLATAMVIRGEAAFQVMGDWVKGEFITAGKVPGKDFACFRFPGTENTVLFNSDQFVMFRVGGEMREAQLKLATAIMNPKFQSAFSVIKGSVPARTDVPDADFDACGKQGMADLARADAAGTLIGSMAHGHAAPAAVKNAFYDVITAHFNGELDTEEAIEELLDAVESVR
jgi:glucose/mannose transport system substrate-binding protein